MDHYDSQHATHSWCFLKRREYNKTEKKNKKKKRSMDRLDGVRTESFASAEWSKHIE